MALCRKSYSEVLSALFALTLIIVSNGLTLFGMFRYLLGLEDDKNINRNHLILAGNLLSICALVGSLFILMSNEDALSIGIKVGLFATMLFTMVMNLYLSNYDPSDYGSEVFVITLNIFDMYVKVTAVLLGYGVCSMNDVPTALNGMMTKVLDGRR